MARVLLDKNDVYVAASSATILGNTGSETVKIQDGVSVIVDSSIERIEFSRASSAYTYKTTLTGMQVLYNNLAVADVVGGQKLSFTDGSASVVLGAFDPINLIAPITLGGVAISSTANSITPTLNTAASEISTMTPTTNTVVGTTSTETYATDDDNGHTTTTIYTYNAAEQQIALSETDRLTWTDDSDVTHLKETLHTLTTNADGTQTEVYSTNDDGVTTLLQYEDVTKNKVNTTPFDASIADVTFNIAESNSSYTFNISKFSNGDGLVFSKTAITPTISNTNTTTDNAVDVVYTDGSIVTTIHLTGISSAQDGSITDYNSFLNTFA